jgi:hypothetical protein
MSRTQVRLQSPIPRLALRTGEAAFACGCSEDYFAEHIAPELKFVRRGRLKLVAVSELQRWLDENAEHLFEGRAA